MFLVLQVVLEFLSALMVLMVVAPILFVDQWKG